LQDKAKSSYYSNLNSKSISAYSSNYNLNDHLASNQFLEGDEDVCNFQHHTKVWECSTPRAQQVLSKRDLLEVVNNFNKSIMLYSQEREQLKVKVGKLELAIRKRENKQAIIESQKATVTKDIDEIS